MLTHADANKMTFVALDFLQNMMGFPFQSVRVP
jgi:hypothetical protein